MKGVDDRLVGLVMDRWIPGHRNCARNRGCPTFAGSELLSCTGNIGSKRERFDDSTGFTRLLAFSSDWVFGSDEIDRLRSRRVFIGQPKWQMEKVHGARVPRFCSVSGFLAFPRIMLFAGAPRTLSDLATPMVIGL